jgi:hypothetical protein
MHAVSLPPPSQHNPDSKGRLVGAGWWVVQWWCNAKGVAWQCQDSQQLSLLRACTDVLFACGAVEAGKHDMFCATRVTLVSLPTPEPSAVTTVTLPCGFKCLLQLRCCVLPADMPVPCSGHHSSSHAANHGMPKQQAAGSSPYTQQRRSSSSSNLAVAAAAAAEQGCSCSGQQLLVQVALQAAGIRSSSRSSGCRA